MQYKDIVSALEIQELKAITGNDAVISSLGITTKKALLVYLIEQAGVDEWVFLNDAFYAELTRIAFGRLERLSLLLLCAPAFIAFFGVILFTGDMDVNNSLYWGYFLLIMIIACLIGCFCIQYYIGKNTKLISYEGHQYYYIHKITAVKLLDVL